MGFIKHTHVHVCTRTKTGLDLEQFTTYLRRNIALVIKKRANVRNVTIEDHICYKEFAQRERVASGD